MRPVSRGYSRHSHVDGDTCRKTPISRSALDKILMPRHLFEDNPFDEGTTLRGTTPLGIVRRNPQVPHTAREVTCHPVNNWRGKQSSMPPHTSRPDSLFEMAYTARDPRQNKRGALRFPPQYKMRPSSIAPNPVESREAHPKSTVFLISHRDPEKLPEVIITSQGNPGFPATTQERPRDSPVNAS